MNTLLLDALHCRNQQRPPVWLMRQAGRYMPEYRAIRSKTSFLEMCHTPDLIAQITELPISRFGFDAAILFSDILVIPEALDVGLRFEDSVGPIIERPVRSAADIDLLPNPSIPEKLSFVAEGIKLLKRTLKVPLIGFCGAPFTVASYMIEGGSNKELKRTKQWMVRDPESFHKLLEKITACTIEYLKLQVDSGVDAIQIFDSWAGALDDSHFRSCSLRYMDKLVKSLEGRVPSILFCRGSSSFALAMAEASPSALSIDWNANLSTLRKTLPTHIALQGNLDPDILYGSPETIKKHVQHLLTTMREEKGYIFNLGHGIHPDVPTESVQALLDAVHSFR